jgi:FemAB-related protein (PEP-CTERM system-associated)
MIELKSSVEGRDFNLRDFRKMNLALPEIKPKEEIKDSVWDEYVLSNPNATFFHLSGWQRILETTFPYRSFSFAEIKDGRISGILPLFLVRNLPFGHSLVSVPLAVYGGICADDSDTEFALLNHARQMADRMGVRYLELRNQVSLEGMPVKDLYVTFRKEIFSDPEKNLAAIPRKQRRMTRQGEKYGLSVSIGGEELLNGFYNVYAQSVRNLGTPVYPIGLFQCLLREFGSSCRILAVFHQKEMVAAVMTFFFRDQVLPYYGGALRAAFSYGANDFMYWSLLSYGAEQGYKIFDFGRSKKGSGPYDFKRHWGFDPTPLPYQYHLVQQREMPNLSPNNPKFSLAIELWKKMPLSMTQWLGPKIIRYFP